jgi:hypothetical protein
MVVRYWLHRSRNHRILDCSEPYSRNFDVPAMVGGRMGTHNHSGSNMNDGAGPPNPFGKIGCGNRETA